MQVVVLVETLATHLLLVVSVAVEQVQEITWLELLELSTQAVVVVAVVKAVNPQLKQVPVGQV
jgi:hypothetical protein